MEKNINFNDYLPNKTEIRIECGILLSYFNLESLESVLSILSTILYFCEDDKDFNEVNRFFKYLSTTSGFGKVFYDRYACIIGIKGKKIVGDLFKNNDHDRIINDFNKESIKKRSLKKVN